MEVYKNTWYARYLKDPDAYEKANTDHLEHIQFLREEFPKRLHWSDEECYEYAIHDYEDERIGPNGELLSTCNPIAKYDYYTIGGRWEKRLKTLHGNFVNQGKVKELDFTNTMPFAYLSPDGAWHEKGSMGSFGLASEEKEDALWKEEFDAFLQKLDGDTTVTVVDCHI